MFKHIPKERLFGTKVGFMKTFKRSDLALKKWEHMIVGQDKYLGQSFMDISRDSVLICVKDN